MSKLILYIDGKVERVKISVGDKIKTKQKDLIVISSEDCLFTGRGEITFNPHLIKEDVSFSYNYVDRGDPERRVCDRGHNVQKGYNE